MSSLEWNQEEPTTPTKNFINEAFDDNTIPKVGMEFESEEAAYNFYNTYAENSGFSIRRGRVHKSNSRIILDRLFVCSCEGTRRPDKRDDDVKQHRPETRFGCLAKMSISCRKNKMYQVTQFVSEHTHVLISPSKSHFLRSHRNLSDSQKIEIDMAESSGIAPKACMNLMARQFGGRENVGFIPEDYRNYLRTRRTVEMKVGDTGGVLEYLQKMQGEDPNFTYAIQVDADDLITNIFWADARMKVDYDRFGDVVSFDTTYRSNKEGRPLALFVGVNHHKQTIIFGVALLYDETINTFEWLFYTFVNSMSGKKPKTILTDQDAAMEKALSTQWPETNHRLCIWHMYQNAAKHLSNVFEKFKNFARDFSSCVYDHDEVLDFVDAWNKLLEKYNLEENEWLKKLYKSKENWALVYGRDTFSADMSTTQRSESMNSKVKDYISYKHDLLQFFKHFQSLLDDRRYEESKADAKSSISTPALPYPVEILKHAATVYTLEVFKIFYEEIWKTWNCSVEVYKEAGAITEYKVKSDKPYTHIVKFNVGDSSVTCSCRKFEFVGILCAHALKIFSLKNIKRVPDCYILKRWTKAAKVNSNTHVTDHCINSDPKEATRKRYKELSRLFNQLTVRASEMEETYEVAVMGHDKILESIEEKIRSLSVCRENSQDLQVTEDIPVGLDVPGTSKAHGPRTRGIKVKPKPKKQGSSKRYMSALEKAAGKKKTKKKECCIEKSSKIIDESAMHGFPSQTQANVQTSQWNSYAYIPNSNQASSQTNHQLLSNSNTQDIHIASLLQTVSQPQPQPRAYDRFIYQHNFGPF